MSSQTPLWFINCIVKLKVVAFETILTLVGLIVTTVETTGLPPLSKYSSVVPILNSIIWVYYQSN